MSGSPSFSGENRVTSGRPARWWATWASQTHPAVPRSFLLAGRDHALSKLRDALRQSSQVISVVAPSRGEAVAVVCASLVDDSEDVDEFASRAVIVSGAGAWERLVDSNAGLVLIPTLEDLDVQAALSRGHRVVIPSQGRPPAGRRSAHSAAGPAEGDRRTHPDDRTRPGRGRPVCSARSPKSAVTAPDDCGQPRVHATRLVTVTPGWPLGSAALAGSWTQGSDGDRETIASLTGRAYTDVEPDLAAWSALEDAPLRRSGQTWRIVSKDDAWDLISPLITQPPTSADSLRPLSGASRTRPCPGPPAGTPVHGGGRG